MRQSKRYFTVSWLVLLALCGVSFACWAEQFSGEYEGVYRATGRAEMKTEAKVIGEGPGLYRAIVKASPSNEPGATGFQLELHGQIQAPRVMFWGYSAGDGWHGSIQDGVLTMIRDEDGYGGQFELKKIERRSPTEGQAPPAGAVVLLPYADKTPPSLSEWNTTTWKAKDDGSMEVAGGGDNLTKKSFGDMKLHIEFFLPERPMAHGQGRSNSGLYIQDRYEVQVLDSFGLVPGSGDCGGLYKVAAPIVNACLPPDHWQTYDIEFRAPRLGPDGKQKEPAKLTVVQNGITIHKDQTLTEATAGGKEGVAEEAPLRLQDHGNPVRYRNIWLVELKDGAPKKK